MNVWYGKIGGWQVCVDYTDGKQANKAISKMNQFESTPGSKLDVQKYLSKADRIKKFENETDLAQ